MEDIVLLEAIEHYINGTLDAADLEHFEHLRQSNPEIDQLVVEHSFFLKQMDSFAAHKHFKSQLETIHTDLIHSKEISVPKEAKVISWFTKNRRKLSVAATVAALFTITALGVLFAYQKGKNDMPPTKPLSSELQSDINQVKNDIKNLKASQKKPIIATTHGTGFFIDNNGYLITNSHVVKNNNSVYVYNEKYGDLTAEVKMLDPENDLAILKITDTSFKPIKKTPYYLSNNTFSLGQKIFTIGYPRPPVAAYAEGYVSSKAANGTLQNKNDFLFTLQVDGGNSGSPIINSKGEVLGLVAAKEIQENGFGVGIKTNSIIGLINYYNDNNEEKIKYANSSNYQHITSNKQTDVISDCVFMIKIK
jgi:serine protease Do